ncbi:CBS domain-containing protein [Methanobacterium petrolearium]|uniref:CBS domain-containing protein n=1 Tax=Methanobacterium petrolearium TaxID=710190 RepID=UPI001AE6107A|nr:CBS domain-containing protein [Methanobacterium petrolearium]MBP1945151.1 Zn-dependent protease/predicted transcriptional regulator [Methanobacterium petrolearium]BDZ71079.1 sporulation protein [Methanobacterium petrolearium]
MKYSFKIFSAFGIPVELHVSFLLLMILIYAVAILNLAPGIDLNAALLITLLFVTVVLHELAHSYVAQRYGIGIEKIILLPIGGVSAMEELPEDPGEELRISIAGPMVNFVIALICYGIYFAFAGSGYYPYIFEFLNNFALVNLILGAFNLIPAYPMDGGRVLRAILARRMSYLQATQTAASVGKFLAMFMAVVGIFWNFFLILIALFIYIGADAEYKEIMVSNILEGVKVEDMMTREVKTVKMETTVEEMLKIMLENKHMGYPVVDGQNLSGIITFHDISHAKQGEENKSITEFMSRDLVTVSPSELLIDAMAKLKQTGVGRLPVVENGQLVGIISRTDIMRAMEILKLKKNG